jgi:hypothetical protein
MTLNVPFASRWITLFAVLIASMSGATEPTEQPHVMDALVAEALSWDNKRALPLLKEAVERHELSDEQLAQLADAAFKASYYERQYELYAVLYAAPTTEMLTWAATHFEPTLDRRTRIEAGYLLLVNYGDTGVPDEIADIAVGVIANETDFASSTVAARLVLAAEHPDANRDLRLVNGLVANFAHGETHRPLFDILPLSTLELLIHAAKDSSDWYLALVINQFAIRAEQGTELRNETVVLLQRLARTSDSPNIIEASSDALRAGAQFVPMRARVLDRRVQSRVLLFVLVAIAVVNAVTAVGGFIFAGVMPLRARGTAARVAIRSGLVIGWLVLTIVMLVALIGGLIGFVGAPRPHRIIQFNWPAYVGTLIYLAIAWFGYRRSRQPVSTPEPHQP